MRQFQLRPYHLRTREAAAAYLPHWLLHVDSLKLCGVETHAYFASLSDPRDVIALISFAEPDDPEMVTRNYMQSDALKQDMAGFDVSQIVGVDTVFLTPGEGSLLV